ncbi:MAG TPA: hypothetical protein VLV86_02300, partial [Vicinamibacterales bacterium]|nr:hypothetical protein [Vicinamibacterales bacterium]
RLQPLAALQAPFANLPRDRVQPAYAQSYLTILFLIDQYDERRVPRLLESLRHSDSLQDAFADVYPLSLDGFEEAADRALG